MSANFGASGGVAAALFDGTRKLFTVAPISCAAGERAQSQQILAAAGFGPHLISDIEPTSFPVPSQGATVTIGAPPTASASATVSCMNIMPTAVWPVAAARIGADPDLVYWLMLVCNLAK